MWSSSEPGYHWRISHHASLFTGKNASIMFWLSDCSSYPAVYISGISARPFFHYQLPAEVTFSQVPHLKFLLLSLSALMRLKSPFMPFSFRQDLVSLRVHVGAFLEEERD
jgi:hypothetical protein